VSTARRLAFLLFAASLASLGCHAQTPARSATGAEGTAIVSGQPLPLRLTRRIAVLLRQKATLPPGAAINISPAMPSDLPGYSKVSVTFSSDGKSSRPIDFLVSTDGKTLAQFNKYDISADPRNLVSDTGRPSRGGPANAPVVIVGFDDLECPFCARLHETIFPAILNRYGDKIHIVYKDFPLDQHPWAMHAAVDVNCLAAQSPTGYWNLVDYIHAHASDIGAAPPQPIVSLPEKPGSADASKEKTLDRATQQLDTLTREQGKFQKVDQPKLDACIAKQDISGVQAEQKSAAAFDIESTPTLFINGDKIDGALPIEFIYGVIDDALRAEGVTPPPPYAAPAAPATPPAASSAKPTAPAAK
jgi:protein-disulfide isomerase